MSGTQRCSDCLYYAIKSGLCRRYPDYVRRGVDSWCGEFKADFATDGIKQRIDFIAAEGSKYVHEYRLNILALAERIERIERKLNHKGGKE